MYEFLPLSPNLSRAFCAAGVWTAGPEPISLLLPADPEFELLWNETPSGATSNFRIASPSLAASWVHSRPEAISVGVRFRPSWVSSLLGADWQPVFSARNRLEVWHRLEALVDRIPSPPALVDDSVLLITEERLTIQQVAEKSGYSYEQGLRRFRSTTHVTPAQLAAYHRLRFATEFARQNPDATLLDVSIEARYSEAAALAHAARRQTGRPFRKLVSSFKMPD